MRKLITTAALLLTLGTAGSAMADHWRGREVRRDNRAVVRDNRGTYHRPIRDSRVVVRDHRWDNTRVVRRPVYVNNNRYTFHDGRSFYYQRPVIQYRYTNYRVRPTILVENYETVPGYVWTAGAWQWSGYEWRWISGHYDVDTRYQDTGYDNTGYDNTGYDNTGYDNTGYDNTGYDNTGYNNYAPVHSVPCD